MKRSGPIKRYTPLKRSTKRIPKVSARRAPLLREYYKRREEFLRKRPRCEVGVICAHTKAATDVHHKAGRLGGNLTNEATWLASCRWCHDYIHTHPTWARQHGFLEL